jgi:hypothetical protein
MMDRKLNLTKMINSYFDGELSKKEEPALFSMIAANEESRDYFRNLHLLRSGVELSQVDFPDSLDNKILMSVDAERSVSPGSAPRYHAWMFPAAGAFAVIFALITFFLMTELQSYRVTLTQLDEKIKTQNQTIEMLYNSFPVVTVKPAINN